ncbi:MAG: hypothetical protein IT567_04800 [Alphaproteobacteria bacterium]|nr:hypothetical protein [Alphaproteobacteria bacterium]
MTPKSPSKHIVSAQEKASKAHFDPREIMILEGFTAKYRKGDVAWPEASREKFSQLLQEAACGYLCRDKRPSEQKEILEDLARSAVCLTEKMEPVLLSIPLIEALRENSPDRVYLQGTSRLRSLLVDLRLLVEAATAAANNIKVKAGRPTSDGSLTATVFSFVLAWELATGKRASTNVDKTGVVRTGPFVDFVCQAIGFLDPQFLRRHASGKTIADELQVIRETQASPNTL